MQMLMVSHDFDTDTCFTLVIYGFFSPSNIQFKSLY